MSQQHTPFIWLGLGLLLLAGVGMLWLQHTTGFGAVQGQTAIFPTPQGVVTLSELGYATPTPNAERQMHATLLADTDPAATRMGEMVAASAPTPNPTPDRPQTRSEVEYYTNERGGASSRERYFVTNPATGQEVRLGDDQGRTRLTGASSNDYILWKYICGCPEEGAYFFTFADQQNTLFRADVAFDVITTAGPWIVYRERSDVPAEETLLAYNVETAEQITLDADPSLYLCFARCGEEESNQYPYRDWVAPQSQFTFNGTTFFWISDDQHIEAYNLATRTHTAYPIPAYAWERPTNLSASDKTVVWTSKPVYWAYDLVNQQLFALRSNPPGWEDIGGSTDVWVGADDQVYIYRGVSYPHPNPSPTVRVRPYPPSRAAAEVRPYPPSRAAAEVRPYPDPIIVGPERFSFIAPILRP